MSFTNSLSSKQDPWLLFVLDLIEQTITNNLQWDAIEPAQTLFSPIESVKYMFKTKFKNKNVVIFEKSWMDDKNNDIYGFLSINPFASKKDVIENMKKSKIVIMICDDKFLSGWEVPDKSAARDLFNSIKYKITGAGELLKFYDSEKIPA